MTRKPRAAHSHQPRLTSTYVSNGMIRGTCRGCGEPIERRPDQFAWTAARNGANR